MDLGHIPCKLTGFANIDSSRRRSGPDQERLGLALRREFGRKTNYIGLSDGCMFTPINAQRAAS